MYLHFAYNGEHMSTLYIHQGLILIVFAIAGLFGGGGHAGAAGFLRKH